VTAHGLDLEGRSTLSVRVRSIDAANVSVDMIFAISVINNNDPPKCTIGIAQTTTDEEVAKSVSGWIKNGSAYDSGQEQIVSFSVATDNLELFSTPPVVDANGTLTYDPAPNVHGTVTITVTVKDDGGTDNGGIDATTYQRSIIVDKAHVWYNAKKSFDVTGEGNINAGDALTVINFINSFGPQKVPDGNNPNAPYYDTDASGAVNAGDALGVINFVNSFGPESGGDPPKPVTEASSGATEASGLRAFSSRAALDELMTLLASDSAQPRRRPR
jgi:hypothetical protein